MSCGLKGHQALTQSCSYHDCQQPDICMCTQTLCVWPEPPSASESISMAHWLFPQMGRAKKDGINGKGLVKTYQESTGNMSKVIELLLCFMGPMSCQTLVALCVVTAKVQLLCCSLHQPYQGTLSSSHWN